MVKSALHMTTKELLDNYGVSTGGIRRVPSNVVQALLAGVVIEIPKFKIDLGKFHGPPV